MSMPSGPVTMLIAGVTFVAWALAALAGWTGPLGYAAGFLPARVSGIVEVAGAIPLFLTPLGAALIHANLLHVGFNLLMLVFCGRFVEHAVGGRLLALLYVAGAYVAALAQYVVDPTSTVPMVGASGAVSAVVGAYALLYNRQQVRAIGPLSSYAVRLLWLAATWIVIQAMIELASFGSAQRIAVAAHVGGFITGLLLARPLLLWRYRNA